MDNLIQEQHNNNIKPKTLVELLRLQAKNHPNKRVFTFLRNGEDDEVHITYHELDQRARLIAAKLQEQDAKGQRALLLYPPGLEYIAAFFGCLYAGVVAVPAYPPRLNRPAPRIHAIIADSQAEIALTSPEILESIEKRFEHEPELEDLDWFDTNQIPVWLKSEWQEPTIETDTLAFLQYTSGSTSIPKGVMLSHRNLLYNLEQFSRGFQLAPDEYNISWLPSYHDMGLIGSIMGTIYNGISSTLLAPLDFLQRPLRWLQAITKYRATITGGPNFAYDFCVERIKPEQMKGLDLSSWRTAFNGSEPVRYETMKRFAETFAPFGFKIDAFYPCYGLAEGTLYISGGNGSSEPIPLYVQRSALERDRIIEVSPDDRDSVALVGCGTAKLDQKINIVNPETFIPCPPDVVGEIWISGENVAHGYWNRPAENENTFGARLDGGTEEKYLRTGDFGFLREGELFITGRLKDLIIIRGSNHYPQDIELTVERSHKALHTAGGGAFSVDIDGEERLVVIQEIDRRFRHEDMAPVIQAIRKAIAEEHDLQVYAIVLIKPFTIPKTSSGKIQRHACKEYFLSEKYDVIEEWRAF